jgi:molybdate transport system permease protein
MDWSAIGLSLRLSTLTTLLLLILGLPLASWLAFSQWRWKFFVEAVVTLPLVLPPTVLGFYLLVAMGPRSPIGQAYAAITGRGLPFSFQGLLIASVIYSLPFAVQPFTAAISTVDRRLIEASWCLGRGWLGTFFRVTLPLSWPGVLTGMVLSFAHTLGEFGVVLMIGGDLAGMTRTISISIFDQVQALDYGAANQTALALLLFSFLVLAVTYGLQKRGVAVWPPG